MLTVTQTARVASKIIPKTTQEGIIPPRRRTSVRVPMISIEICCTEAKEPVRGATRCDLILSSTQYVFATLLTSITSQFLCLSDFAQVSSAPKLRSCLTEFCGFGHNIVGSR